MFALSAAVLLLALVSNPVQAFLPAAANANSAACGTRARPPSSSSSSSSSSSTALMAHEPRSSSASSTDRRAALQNWAATGALATLALVPLPAAAKKYTNLEDARAAGERKLDEIEKAKGPLITARDGVKYREELVGKGDTFDKGDLVKIRYQVYKGNGDYMFSTGYGREFQNDVGDTYDFTFGRPNSIPKGAEIGMEGMRVGGKRKILVPPNLGWSTSGGLPEPQTFGGKRKLLNNIEQPLQFEVELIRVRKKGQGKGAAAAGPEAGKE